MRNIDKIAKRYPQLDLLSVQILLTIYENPGYSIREVAEIIVMDPKTVQEKITMLGNGRKNQKWTKLRLINTDYKVSDQRCRNLILTSAGRTLAEQLSVLL